ncbi:MAG: hypothetical protein AB7G28_21555 [Pirellulales bacterium]
MWKIIANFGLVVLLAVLMSPVTSGQSFTYEFDGKSDNDPQPADPTDWMTPENWNDGFSDPDGSFGPLVPDFNTRVEITDGSYTGSGTPTGYGINAPVIGPGDAAEAYEVRIGRANGPGMLTMTGGTLKIRDNCNFSPYTCNSSPTRIRVGNADVETADERFPGYFSFSGGDITTDTLWIGSGSHGEMTMTGGTVFTRGNLYMDWTSDLTYDSKSILNISGGSIHVGSSTAFGVTTPGLFKMHRLSEMYMDGGTILVDGAAELGGDPSGSAFQQAPDVTVNITDGLFESKSYLRIGGSIMLDGGILRASRFNEAVSTGTIDINGGGLLQFKNSEESVAAVQALITSGFLTTSAATPLIVEIVDVGGVNFTQVSLGAVLGLRGDYNDNDIIDAADYTAWRDANPGGALINDDNGVADNGDYAYWKSHFGETSGSGSLGAVQVPEPTSAVLCLFAAAALIRCGRAALTNANHR